MPFLIWKLARTGLKYLKTENIALKPLVFRQFNCKSQSCFGFCRQTWIPSGSDRLASSQSSQTSRIAQLIWLMTYHSCCSFLKKQCFGTGRRSSFWVSSLDSRLALWIGQGFSEPFRSWRIFRVQILVPLLFQLGDRWPKPLLASNWTFA